MRPHAHILFAAVTLTVALPTLALAWSENDACDKTGKIYTVEGPDGPSLICDGANLKILESADVLPTRKGVNMDSPETTFDVNGEIRPGYTGLTCSATVKGAIRYDSANNVVAFCNGSAWTTFPVADTSDQTPNAYTFTALTNQSLNTLVQSNSPTISGFTGAVVASVSGGGNPEISINGGAWVTSGAISSGQTVQIRLTTSGSVSTLRTATVAIGTATADWSVTTRAGSLLIFSTLSGYVGTAIGSVANADALCQTAANAAGYAGSYKAILSDETTDAKDRLTLSYPIVRATDGTTVVASTNLWVGSLDNAVSTTGSSVWTGTNAAGAKTAGETCSSWTGGTNGKSGLTQQATGSWTSQGTTTCSGSARLYCIQQ